MKRNRLVSTSVDTPYQRVEALSWTQAEVVEGQVVHIKKFPKGHQVKLFRIASASGRTEYIATNDLSQCDVETMEKRTRLRWKIEQLHRELQTDDRSWRVSVSQASRPTQSYRLLFMGLGVLEARCASSESNDLPTQRKFTS